MAKKTKKQLTLDIWSNRNRQCSTFEQVKFVETELKKDFRSEINLRDLVETFQKENLWESDPIEVSQLFIESKTVRQKICENYRENKKLRSSEFVIDSVADMFSDPDIKFQYQPEMDNQFLDTELKESPFARSVQKWFPLSSEEQLKNSLSYEYILSTLLEEREIQHAEKVSIENKIAAYDSRQALSEASVIDKANAKAAADKPARGFGILLDIIFTPLIILSGGRLSRLLFILPLIGVALFGLYYCSEVIDNAGKNGGNKSTIEKDYMRKCLANGTTRKRCEEQFQYIKDN